MSQYTVGFIMGGIAGSLIGFLVAFWLILAWVNGYWGDRE